MTSLEEYDQVYWARHEILGESWRSMSKMLRAHIAADLVDTQRLYNIAVPKQNRIPFAND